MATIGMSAAVDEVPAPDTGRRGSVRGNLVRAVRANRNDKQPRNGDARRWRGRHIWNIWDEWCRGHWSGLGRYERDYGRRDGIGRC